jgi:hypothetical protein
MKPGGRGPERERNDMADENIAAGSGVESRSGTRSARMAGAARSCLPLSKRAAALDPGTSEAPARTATDHERLATILLPNSVARAGIRRNDRRDRKPIQPAFTGLAGTPQY